MRSKPPSRCRSVRSEFVWTDPLVATGAPIPSDIRSPCRSEHDQENGRSSPYRERSFSASARRGEVGLPMSRQAVTSPGGVAEERPAPYGGGVARATGHRAVHIVGGPLSADLCHPAATWTRAHDARSASCGSCPNAVPSLPAMSPLGGHSRHDVAPIMSVAAADAGCARVESQQPATGSRRRCEVHRSSRSGQAAVVGPVRKLLVT